MSSERPYLVDQNFIAGVDVGGTKVHILDTLSHTLHRYHTNKYADLNELLADYFDSVKMYPARVAVAMAGPRDDVTGAVRMTNYPWPAFNPQEAAGRFSGVSFTTANDMVAAMAGALDASTIDLAVLKPGREAANGTKITVTISTGVNACVAVWDSHSRRRVFLEAEAGHMGFQPNTEAQDRHLRHLRSNFKHPSVELALSGKHGIESWIAHSPEMASAPDLATALEKARKEDRPVGAVLLEFATEGHGTAQAAAHAVLDDFAVLAANILADYTLVYKATGGVYLTGSVALALGEYLADKTSFTKAFVRVGSKEHAPWLEDFLSNVPIYLVTNPNVAVSGALSLAQAD